MSQQSSCFLIFYYFLIISSGNMYESFKTEFDSIKNSGHKRPHINQKTYTLCQTDPLKLSYHQQFSSLFKTVCFNLIYSFEPFDGGSVFLGNIPHAVAFSCDIKHH